MKMGRRSSGGFLEESSGCPGSSLSELGVCPHTSCLRVIQVSLSHIPDTVGHVFSSSHTS